MEQQQKNASDKRSKELEDERIRITKAHEQLAAEKQQKEERLKEWKNEAKKVVAEKQDLRKHEGELKQMAKGEYNKLSDERTISEIKKEQEYKDFFKRYDDHMKARQEVHQSAVNSIEKPWKDKFQQWEKQREEDFVCKLKAKDEKDYYTKLQAKTEVNEVLKKQLEEKDKERDVVKKSYPVRAQENLLHTQRLATELLQEKEKKMTIQQKYREFLETQIKVSPKTTLNKLKRESYEGIASAVRFYISQ